MTATAPRFLGDANHLAVLLDAAQRKEASVWNDWRQKSNVERPDLRGADLSEVVLHEVNLQFADLTGACLRNATITASLDYALLNEADLTSSHMWLCRLDETQLVSAICRRTEFWGSRIVASNFSHAQLQGADFERCYLEDTFFDDADLTDATFYQADLWMAFLRRATMNHVNLRGANLHGAKLAGATLARCDLRRTVLVDSDVQGTTISDCDVYGVSAWGLARSEDTVQRNLRISTDDEAPLYVDDLEVAQFIHLMVHNPRIRDVIDTISKKAVLILGRFTPERKAVLDGIRARLRELGYVPMIFDFEKPTQRDFEETVKVLAGLSRFVIVDITNPSSSPLEIHATVPEYMIPFVPIIMLGEKPFSMFEGLQQKYSWVLDTVEYPSEVALIRDLEKEVIAPALDMEARIVQKRMEPRRTRRLTE
jgi:uncharacterized protein YjbI with pentapeptide repeats